MRYMFYVYSSVILLLFLYTPNQSLAQTTSTSDKPSISAMRVTSDISIQIDGMLNEAIWDEAEVATGFVQNFPNDGAAPSERTEIRILYSDKYLYVGAIAFDSSPLDIAATLFRRDGDEYSDWIIVSIDSYNDKRTAFTFGVNPRGVQKDMLYFDDDEEDILWDAVWDSETSINAEGWIAEFRIPLSQLRFTSSKNEQTWGINFERQIARLDEINYWSRIPREEFGEVSWSGNLLGIQDLKKPLRLEIVPYVSGELTREPDLFNADPFYEKNALTFKAGGDFKYGISSDFTLTGTINPDFGQVEADPATINLTAFEVFFEEQRPFFLEGADIFAFGKTTSQNTFSSHSNFYSRRIGKTPFGSPELAGLDSGFEDSPSETTIAGAAKVSGKTKGGLSLGILNAYTLEEKANYSLSDGSNFVYVNNELVVEPATNYLVSRVRQDLNNGDTQIGGFFSSVNRMMEASYLEDYIHESAYQIGIDGQHFWENRNWGASGVLSFSQVNGTENALLRTQMSSARFYNRIDSEYSSIDTTLTSLTGYYGEFSIGKYSGAGLRYSLTYSEMSPGYEVNDIGFLERSDYRSPQFYVEYLNVSSDLFRFYLLWGYGGYAWNFDGDRIMNYYASGAYFQLNNLWTILAIATKTGQFYDDRSSRGGATLDRPQDFNISLDITSNSTNNFYANIGGNYRRDASGEISTGLYSTANYRPNGYVQLSVSPGWYYDKSTNEKPDFYDDYDNLGFGSLFSDASINLFYTEFRLNWTFSPKLSLQTYIRPLIYSADFYNQKFFSESKTYNFRPLSDVTNEETTASFERAFDFDYRTIQGNFVLRYEYRPGSTFFLVWQQERENIVGQQSNFTPFQSSVDLFSDDPTNIFLIKFSYWFGN